MADRQLPAFPRLGSLARGHWLVAYNAAAARVIDRTQRILASDAIASLFRGLEPEDLTAQEKVAFRAAVGVDGVDQDARDAAAAAGRQAAAATAAVAAVEADGWVTTERIADDAVTQAKVATDAIGPRELQAESVRTGHLADAAVTADQVARDSILSRHIAADQVTRGELAADAVGTPELVDQAVTRAKLAPEVLAEVAAGAIVVDDPAAPVAPTAAHRGQLLYRPADGRLNNLVAIHHDDPAVDWRAFGTADLAEGQTWGGAHQVNPAAGGLAVGTVVYSLPARRFLVNRQIGSRRSFQPLQLAGFLGHFDDEAAADRAATAAGQIAEWGGTVRVVSAWAARRPDTYAWALYERELARQVAVLEGLAAAYEARLAALETSVWLTMYPQVLEGGSKETLRGTYQLSVFTPIPIPDAILAEFYIEGSRVLRDGFVSATRQRTLQFEISDMVANNLIQNRRVVIGAVVEMEFRLLATGNRVVWTERYDVRVV